MVVSKLAGLELTPLGKHSAPMPGTSSGWRMIALYGVAHSPNFSVARLLSSAALSPTAVAVAPALYACVSDAHPVSVLDIIIANTAITFFILFLLESAYLEVQEPIVL